MADLSTYVEPLKERKKKGVIAKAIKHEDRLRFHTETYLEPGDIARPVTEFLNWVKSLLPKDKYNIFLNLFKFPTPVIDLTKEIYGELERVFDGKNPVRDYRFEDSDLKSDWAEYQKKHLKSPAIWRTTGWDTVKTAINSILVVDLPAEQSGARPEPYFYFLGIQHVIDYRVDSEGKLIYLIFKQENNRLAIFDDEFYRTVEINDRSEIIEGSLIEKPHDLGYCPAMFFWSDALSQKQIEIKEAPISAQLYNLDWLLFFMISKKHLDLYAPYPIYSAYEAECDFENVESGDYCDGGFLRGNNDDYRVYNDGTLAKCPVCADKRLAGVGSFIEVPIPEKDGPDLRKPVDITTIDRESLDYNVDEQNRLTEELRKSVVGAGGMSDSREAMNIEHVRSNFDAKTSVLRNLKTNFEAAETFAGATCCRLRYGSQFIGNYISLGTEFYIATVDDLYKIYKQAKENGSNESELDALKDQIIMTEYRNDPQMLQRLVILRHLEPYPHNTREELLALNKEGLIDPVLMKIKINFNNFIDKFERENLSILEFGSLANFNVKIEAITEKLKDYVNNQNTVPARENSGEGSS